MSVMGMASTAYGLEQTAHRKISRNACTAAGLPSNFCARVGTEAYNVDSYEWNDLAAHAQVDVARGQTTCQAANLVAVRVYGLASEVHDGLIAKAEGESWADGQRLATGLGRALHTVQDNCTHHGISNPQHGWYSLSDSCSGTRLSPDLDADALSCARTETARAMRAFVASLGSAGLSGDDLDDGVAVGVAHYPARADVCAYLKSGNTWSGVDAHWEGRRAVPAMMEQVEAGMAGGDAPADVCHGDPNALTPAARVASLDTSHAQALCFTVSLYCLGKADGAADEAPPWAEAEAPLEVEVDAPAPAGCAVASGAPRGADSWATLALLAGLTALFGARRRQRAR